MHVFPVVSLFFFEHTSCTVQIHLMFQNNSTKWRISKTALCFLISSNFKKSPVWQYGNLAVQGHGWFLRRGTCGKVVRYWRRNWGRKNKSSSVSAQRWRSAPRTQKAYELCVRSQPEGFVLRVSTHKAFLSFQSVLNSMQRHRGACRRLCVCVCAR